MGARVASPGWGHACVDNLGPWQRFAPAFSEATRVVGRETARSPAERGVRGQGRPSKERRASGGNGEGTRDDGVLTGHVQLPQTALGQA